MPLNHRLLYQTYQQIKAQPERFFMGGWGHYTSCGTVACFAGRVAILDGTGHHVDRILRNNAHGFDSDLVKCSLGLSNKDLFFLNAWPIHIQNMYIENPIKALRQAILHFTGYNPEFAFEQGDSLPADEIILSVPSMIP